MVKSAQGSKNAFNITNPARYRCQVFHYHRKLSRLYLSVYQGQRSQPAFFILFSDVAYIQAPMSWLGADFEIAERDDCVALMLEAGLVGEAIHQFPDAYASITDYARLYRARSLHCEIRIIASSAAIMQTIPGEIQ
ncbi:MAG: hypothetical protein OXI34_10805 [Chloroflexota bacterium]|nr:hypothetical protein [Chloroflexota bacterium]MDE2948201.1 hypothetical protein [Chloroflexota bacterium]